jgi:signal transduction histidine kinase
MTNELQRTQKLLQEETAARLCTLEQLRHADRLTTIGTLASGVAHELGTPLNVVSEQVNLLQPTLPSQEIQQVRAALREQVDKMAKIVRQLLSFSRKRIPEKSTVDLHEILGKTIRMLTPFGEKRNITIQFLHDRDSAFANVDGSQIEQVFTNLLVNAIQAMNGGEIVVGVTTNDVKNSGFPDSRPEPHRCIFVKDYGIGMSPVEMQQIFDPFYTTKTPEQGTGMGLSIAHGIVKDHKGWISVASGPGEGTCFSVFLPIGKI